MCREALQCCTVKRERETSEEFNSGVLVPCNILVAILYVREHSEERTVSTAAAAHYEASIKHAKVKVNVRNLLSHFMAHSGCMAHQCTRTCFFLDFPHNFLFGSPYFHRISFFTPFGDFFCFIFFVVQIFLKRMCNT